MNYFPNLNENLSYIINTAVYKAPFVAGDILNIAYNIKGLNYFFEGICISLKKKQFSHPETSFIVRNLLDNVGVEIAFSYFYNFAFSFKSLDYKKKKQNYYRSKIFYVRHKLNKFSRVK
jgi:ribosomal protein L19